MTAFELLATLKNQGFTLRPVEGGKLRIEPGSRLTAELTEQLRQYKAELLALLTRPAPAWPCPHCGRPAEIEAVEPSLDGERMLTYWRCDACPAAGVKPEPLKEPPQTVKPAPSPLKARYHKAAEAVMNDCLAIDPLWLADHQTQLWQRMVLIDRQLERLQARNAEAAEYEALLEKLVATVKQARARYEQERQKKAVSS
jgi:hypothetical protein